MAILVVSNAIETDWISHIESIAPLTKKNQPKSRNEEEMVTLTGAQLLYGVDELYVLFQGQSTEAGQCTAAVVTCNGGMRIRRGDPTPSSRDFLGPES